MVKAVAASVFPAGKLPKTLRLSWIKSSAAEKSSTVSTFPAVKRRVEAEIIAAGAADETIHAIAARQGIGMVAAMDVVVAGKPEELIVAAVAIEGIAVAIAGERVGMVRALQALDRDEDVSRRIARGAIARREACNHA